MTHADTLVDLRLAEQDHRTANMLQLVASLLGRHAERAPDPLAAEALRAADAQIRAFAMVNQALHTPGAGVACGAHYLRALGGHLQAACLAPRGLSLALHLPASAPMDCRDAQAMGLVVVEAVTNAVKHAFPGGRAGRLAISLATDRSGSNLVCTICDDGIGMQHDPAGQGGGRGLTFMRMLADRLGGAFAMGSGEHGSWISFGVRPFPFWSELPAATVPVEQAAQPTTTPILLELPYGQA